MRLPTFCRLFLSRVQVKKVTDKHSDIPFYRVPIHPLLPLLRQTAYLITHKMIRINAPHQLCEPSAHYVRSLSTIIKGDDDDILQRWNKLLQKDDELR